MSVISQDFHKIRGIAGLFINFLGKAWEIKAIYIQHHSRAKVSSYYSDFKMLARTQVTPSVVK